MKRIARVAGLVLVVVGAFLLLQGLHIIPGQFLHGPWSLGWGAWGLMFGAFFIVWGNSPTKPKPAPPSRPPRA